MGDLGPESAIFIIKQDFQWTDWDTNPAPKPQPTIRPACKMCMGKDGAESGGVANRRLVCLKIHAIRGSPRLTLVMILCYTCRKEPSITIIRGFPQQLMKTDAESQSQMLGRVWGILQKTVRKG